MSEVPCPSDEELKRAVMCYVHGDQRTLPIILAYSRKHGVEALIKATGPHLVEYVDRSNAGYHLDQMRAGIN